MHALDIRLRLSIVIVVIITVWGPAALSGSSWLLLPAAGLAGQSTVRYLRVRALQPI